MGPGQWGCGYRLAGVLVHLLREELQLVDVFRTPVDQDSCLVIVPEPTLVQGHPEGRDEPWIAALVHVLRVSTQPVRCISERALDLARGAYDPRIISLQDRKRIGQTKQGRVDGRIIRFDRLEETAFLLVPEMCRDSVLQCLSIFSP